MYTNTNTNICCHIYIYIQTCIYIYTLTYVHRCTLYQTSLCNCMVVPTMQTHLILLIPQSQTPGESRNRSLAGLPVVHSIRPLILSILGYLGGMGQ